MYMVVDVTPAAFETTPLLDVVRFPAAEPPDVVPLFVVPVAAPPAAAGTTPPVTPGTEPPAVATAPGGPGTPVGADRPCPFCGPPPAGPICTVEPQAATVHTAPATASERSTRIRRMPEVFALPAADSSSGCPKSAGRPLTSGHLLP